MRSSLARWLAVGFAAAVPAGLIAFATVASADSPAPGAAAQPVGDADKGQQLYSSSGCTACHGASLEGGVGPKLHPIQKLSGVDNPVDPAYLIATITNGRSPSDGYGPMPAKGGASNLSDQDIKDLAAFIIRSQTEKAVLSPQDLARSTVTWITIGIGAMVLVTYLLARYNMRWIARRAAERSGSR